MTPDALLTLVATIEQDEAAILDGQQANIVRANTMFGRLVSEFDDKAVESVYVTMNGAMVAVIAQCLCLMEMKARVRKSQSAEPDPGRETDHAV